MFGFIFPEQNKIPKNKEKQRNQETLKELKQCLDSKDMGAISSMLENNKLPDELTHSDEFQDIFIKSIEDALINNPTFAIFINNEFEVFEISKKKIKLQKTQNLLEKSIINLLKTPQTSYNINQNYKNINNIIKKFYFDTTVIDSSDEIQDAFKKFICSALTIGSFQIALDIISATSISKSLMTDKKVQKTILISIENAQRHIRMINNENQKAETEKQIEKIKQYLKNQ